MMRTAIHIFTASLIGISIGVSAHAVEKKPPSPQTVREDSIEARCKAEAKKRYSFLHPRKRRVFERNCIDRARR
jgi:hypothetical protein